MNFSKKGSFDSERTLKYLSSPEMIKGKNLQMPGDGRYQPKDLRPYLGYDQWAAWLIIVEYFWMKALASIEVIPGKEAELLTDNILIRMLRGITTTKQDIKEKKSGEHDILALLALMRAYLPKPLHKWLHFCATSYDIINTAYALQIRFIFEQVFMPKLYELDELWRRIIKNSAETIQAGRTHLQTALPITIGFWQSNPHSRFVNCARRAYDYSCEVPGKFTGATGTFASQKVLIGSNRAEGVLMEILGLPTAEVTTQITPPEATARFYHELMLLSGALAQLGDDTRILQSSQYGELLSASSSSSAMSHKKANPIAAENLCGMHTTVIAEYMKLPMTLVSNLQRDLRWSNVMRSYSAVMVYVYQQLLTAIRLLKSVRIDDERCKENFDREKRLVVAELLHLSLQKEGLPEAHSFVNKEIVPMARTKDLDLYETMEVYAKEHHRTKAARIWREIRSTHIKTYLLDPDAYIGDAVKIARHEAGNKL